MIRKTSIAILGSLLMVALSPGEHLFAQVRPVYDDMSLDELLDVNIVVTASKTPEDLFETPLSVTIIKRSEILQSGATSIMEALRLSRGLVVREVTPGNWDVHIRGFDDITKNAYISLPFNTTLLVMIDSRIVYSYFTGGTFWEALPVDVLDVERIEIVRGPASALYGSNAVTGVINIITMMPDQKGFSNSTRFSTGGGDDNYFNSFFSYNWNHHTKLSLSGHASQRTRQSNSYYDWWTEAYVPADSLNMFMNILKNIEAHDFWTYSDFRDSVNSDYDVGLSLEKRILNLNLFHQFSPSRNINFSASIERSAAQVPGFLNFVTPLSIHSSLKKHVELHFVYNSFNGQISYNTGEHLSNYAYNSHKSQDLGALLEYNWDFGKGFIRPGLAYRYIDINSPLTYDDPFDLTSPTTDFTGASHQMRIQSAYFLSEYRPNSRLRFIGGFRLDHFDINENLSLNHELALTYRINKHNLIRLVKSRATRSPFIFDTFLNARLFIGDYISASENQSDLFSTIDQQLFARKDQAYLTNDTYETAWRKKLSASTVFDLELFTAKMTNVLVSNEYRKYDLSFQLNQSGEIDSLLAIGGNGQMYFETFDVQSSQTGISSSVTTELGPRLELKLYGTLQRTTLSGRVDQVFLTTKVETQMDSSLNTMDISTFSYTNPTLWSEKLTPTLYGGFSLNFSASPKININLNSYFMGKQIFGGLPFYNITADFTGNYYYNYFKIPASTVVNLKLSVKISKHASLFISGRNLLGSHREFGFTDPIDRSYFVGFEW